MTPERWQQVKQVLAAVLELDPEKRTDFLERSFASDPALRDDLEPMLASEESLREEFLSESDLAAAVSDIPFDETTWIGRRIGAYQVVEQIGAGGMGEVYRAFRADDQYRKEVALKFVRGGQFGSAIFARFKTERQILAGLDHPNLAKLLDGGATEEGFPYLVMELIEGQPITEYCDSRNLSIRERLRLFLQVCSAVHYAHQHLVIHRDIKPHNILVTPDGIPKLLDFGIAKILDAGTAELLPDATMTGFQVFTPRYASPEQIMGGPMSTASDVYSLGVVLYELLTGSGPYDLANVPAQDISRLICDTEPQKPSAAVHRSQRAPEFSARRQTSPDRLRRQLTGDIDNIVLMAMRREPSRRYASVKDLQEDIHRHLENIPVIARTDAAWYRANRFVKRHTAGVAATAAAVLILIVSLIVTIRAELVAKRRFNDVRALANSLIFDVHDAVKDLPGSTPARKIIVDRALKYLNVLSQESSGDLGLQRELATAYEKVGSVQGDYLENNLGDFEGTLVSYRKALELRKQIDAASRDWNDRLALAQAYRLVAHQQWANGDPRGAREPISRAIAVSEEVNNEHPNNLKILSELGFDLEVSGRIGYPGDSSASQKVLEDYRRSLAIDELAFRLKPDDIVWLHGYATDLSNVGNMLEPSDPQEALKYYEKGLKIDKRLAQLTTDVRYQRSVAMAYGSIGSVYDDMGDYARSLENNLQDVAIYEQLVAADPKNALLQQGLAIASTNVAASAVRAGKIEMALDYSSRALERMRPLASSGPKNAFQQYVFAAILVMRGTILVAARQPEAARTEIEHGRSIYEALFKAGNMTEVNAAAAGVKLGEALAAAGNGREAANAFHEALATLEPLNAAQSPNLDALYAAADAYSGLGELSMKAARQPGLDAGRRKALWTEAHSWLSQSENTWRRIQHPNHTAPNSFQAGDPAIVARELKAADTALASLH
jgi:serine/threonine protein kinase/tetratricopeptide (TPR) repeat protein